jgi:hypothetical protein
LEDDVVVFKVDELPVFVEDDVLLPFTDDTEVLLVFFVEEEDEEEETPFSITSQTPNVD